MRTSTGALVHRIPTAARPARSRRIAQEVLLACGIISTLLYAITDALAGLRYPGYSFFSQAISELGAIGAPSEQFVGPLFVAYNLLVVIFGTGVAWSGTDRRRRALQAVGALLIAYGAIGLVTASGLIDPSYFKMHVRGTGSLPSDAPHIILTAVLVLILLVSIGVGAFAFGPRFRRYSFASLAIIIVFGVLTSLYAPRVAANLPTPGMGLLERIDVYAAMLWIAVLGVVLLRPAPPEIRRVPA